MKLRRVNDLIDKSIISSISNEMKSIDKEIKFEKFETLLASKIRDVIEF